MNNIVIGTDVAQSLYDITNPLQGQIAYDNANSILIYDGNNWQFVKQKETIFEKRKRIIYKLLSEK